jgi:hypothetical protein
MIRRAKGWRPLAYTISLNSFKNKKWPIQGKVSNLKILTQFLWNLQPGREHQSPVHQLRTNFESWQEEIHIIHLY